MLGKDDRSEEEPCGDSQPARRFDGGSKRFKKNKVGGFGEIAGNIEQLNSAIEAAQDDEAAELAKIENELEELLKRQNELCGSSG